MNRKSRNMVALLIVMALWALMLAPYAHAQAPTTSVPFTATAQVTGNVQVPAPAGVSATPVVVRVPDTKQVAALAKSNGELVSENANLRALNDAIREENSRLLRENTMSKSDNDGLIPWWWLLVVALLAWMLGRASRSGSDHDAHIHGPLVQGPLVTMPPQPDKGKGDLSEPRPWLVMDHLPEGANITFTRDRRPDKPADPAPATPPAGSTATPPGTPQA